MIARYLFIYLFIYLFNVIYFNIYSNSIIVILVVFNKLLSFLFFIFKLEYFILLLIDFSLLSFELNKIFFIKL